MRKKFFKARIKILTVMLLLTVFCPGLKLYAYENSGDKVPYNSYTYWYALTGEEKTAAFSRDMYEVKKTVNSQNLQLNKPIGLLSDSFCFSGKTYLLDAGNSQIVILNEDYTVNRVIGELTDEAAGESLNYKEAQGIFVYGENDIFIADTLNGRVIECNGSGKVIKKYNLPDSELIPASFEYRPQKVTKDSRGYMYILSEGSFYGAIMYDPNGSFMGFYGANEVKASLKTVFQNIYNKLFLNNAKKSASERVLPYQFTDIFVDAEDFVYTSTGNTSIVGKETEQIGQIRKLSPGGKNVLGSDGIDFTDTAVDIENQNIVGIEVDENGFMYAVDAAYGHVFVFDSECNMISAFGGGTSSGIQKGSFTFPSSIALNGDDVIVTDKTTNSMTVFGITDYGKMLKEAQTLTVNGYYTEAKPMWDKILKSDRNNQNAYYGLAKGYYAEGNYKKAMEYSKLGCARGTYAKAFEKLRNGFIKKYFPLIVVLIILVLVSVVILKRRSKDKSGEKRLDNERLKCYLGLLAHPAETFRQIKEKKTGSVTIAVILTVLYYITSVIKYTWGGFAYVIFDSENFNSLFVFLQTVCLIILFTVAFWCVSTLFGGLGKLKDIFITTAYAFTPLIIGNIVWVIATNVLVPSELSFLSIFMTIMLLYSLFLLSVGMITVNDFEFKKFLLVTVLAVIGMVIILFLLIVVFMLLQLTAEFIKTVISEIVKLV